MILTDYPRLGQLHAEKINKTFKVLTEFKHVPPRYLLGAYKATHAEQGTFSRVLHSCRRNLIISSSVFDNKKFGVIPFGWVKLTFCCAKIFVIEKFNWKVLMFIWSHTFWTRISPHLHHTKRVPFQDKIPIKLKPTSVVLTRQILYKSEASHGLPSTTFLT